MSFLIFPHSTAKGFRERVFMNHGDFKQFCNKVFGGWDFNIGDEKNGRLIHKSIHREFSVSTHNQPPMARVAVTNSKIQY